MAATDVRPKITMACQECKHRNYITKKNRRNDPDRLSLKKFCPNCRMPHASTARPARSAAPAGQHRPSSPLGRAAFACLRGATWQDADMALDPSFIGRTYPPTPPYEVGREKIREFAAAIGDANPVYVDPAAARRSGYPDVIAPPTFPIVVTLERRPTRSSSTPSSAWTTPGSCTATSGSSRPVRSAPATG